MNCCANCFGDFEVKGFINVNSSGIGSCDFCRSRNVDIIAATELYDLFQPLVSIYQRAPSRQTEDQSANNLYITDFLKQDWPLLFRFSDDSTILELVVAIFSLQPDSLIKDPVEPCYQTDEIQEALWADFVTELKSINRFFIDNVIDTQLLRRLLQSHERPYRKGKVFYRARISTTEKLDISQMSKPPSDKATAGRANPKGISYLYVSNDIETTLYETRASLLDYVTIGSFKLTADLRVINLRDNGAVSPFLLEDAIETYMSHRNYLSKLGQELSKPIRRQDSELDYLPTQYLCEFIKSLGYDGVEYKSSLNPNGFNLAIFNDSKLICIKTNLFEVKSIAYDIEEVVTQ